MKQFNRQYRLSAGIAGGFGFEIGATTEQSPEALHINFGVNKADTEQPCTANISVWNLSPANLAVLNQENCIVALRAGYDNHMPLIFVGGIVYRDTGMDGGDRATIIEATDGGIELRYTYVSLSYAMPINTRKIIEDVATQMGVPVTFSYNAQFFEFANGFSFIGPAGTVLDKAVASSGLMWHIYNGVLQVKMRGDTMNREVVLLSPETGLIGIPRRITYAKGPDDIKEQSGWEVEYLMNGAIGIGDFIRLESQAVQGYFRMRSVEMNGDNLEGDWLCRARLIETH